MVTHVIRAGRYFYTGTGNGKNAWWSIDKAEAQRFDQRGAERTARALVSNTPGEAPVVESDEHRKETA